MNQETSQSFDDNVINNIINNANEINFSDDNDSLISSDETSYIYIVKEDGQNIGAFFSKASARSYMNLKTEDFCSNLICSSYRFYKEWSEDDDVLEVTAYNRFLGVIPYEQTLKSFVCEKVVVTPLE